MSIKDFKVPVVNMNGDTFTTLDDQLKAVHEAADVLRKAMTAATPHGRNYQTYPNGAAATVVARNAWHEGCTEVQAIYNTAWEARMALHRAVKIG